MMAPLPNSAARAIWLLTRLRLLRLFNILNTFSWGKKKPRQGTQRKRTVQWILTPLVGLAMLFSFVNILHQSVLNLHCALDVHGCHGASQSGIAAQLQAHPISTALAAALTLQMLLMWLSAILLPLSSRELAQAEWDLEWLATLPVRRAPLLWARLLERSVVNPAGVLALWPGCSVLAWYGGHGWLSIALGAGAALLLLMQAALVRTLADTGLRLSLPPSQLRNLQAMASVACLPVMYMAMSYAMARHDSFTFGWARAFPAWTLWTPPGLAVQAMTAHSAAQAGLAALLLAVQTALVMVAGVALLQYQLRAGIVAGGAREGAPRRTAMQGMTKGAAYSAAAAHEAAPEAQGTGGRRPPAGDHAGLHPQAHGTGWRARLSAWFSTLTPLQRRELMLLGRDRNFLVQSLLVPVVIVGSQLVFNNQLSSIARIGENQQLMAAVAFGIGSYVLMLSAFQTLNTEGNALWMLYTFPRSLESMLREKAKLWGVLALLYPLLVFATGLTFTPVFDGRLAWLALVALAGVPVFSGIAIALGVFACDPLAQETHARVRPTYTYLYMLLCGLYGYGLYAQEWIQTVAIMVLTGGLSLALWQKARDALPYLLDPNAAPPARVALSDGLIAATLFFVAQLLIGAVLAHGKPLTPRDLAQTFTLAGAFVYAVMRFIYWRNKTSGVPAMLAAAPHGGAAPALRDALKNGLAAAAIACAFGAFYLQALHGTVWDHGAVHSSLWTAAMAVLAAPVFEEFIFRGLIHTGLRRLLPPLAAALGSAAIFAIVHPSVSMMPVFVLGLCAAWAHARSTSLLAPMVVHAVYNAAIVALQFKF
jgi:membrane protease YdiL (CAAX protease family)